MPAKKSKLGGLVSIIKSSYRSYRKVADPVKPFIDRVVDPTATFIGANVALGATIYYTKLKVDQALEHLLTSGMAHNAYEAVKTYFQNNPGVETFGELLLLYAPLNYYLLPKCARMMFKGERIPTQYLQKLADIHPPGFHHLRTWATLAAMVTAFYMGNVREDVKIIGGKVGEVGSKIIDVINDKVLHKYVSGEKAHQIFADISDLFDIEAYRLPVPDSREIETELNRAEKKKPDIKYVDRISEDAATITRKGIKITPEQLAYLARVHYFEATFDSKAGKDRQKILDGVHAVTHVIKNRWEFENNIKDGTFGRKNKKDSIFDVAFHHGTRTRNEKTYTVWQFTCIKDHPKYFFEHRGKKGWDLYEGGNINVAVGGMDPVRAQIAYEGIVDVLSGRVPDLTSKSLFYQNPRFADRHNRDWDKKLTKVTEVNSHVFYKFKEGSTVGPHASHSGEQNIEAPKSQKYAIPESQKPMLAYARNNSITKRRFHRAG